MEEQSGIYCRVFSVEKMEELRNAHFDIPLEGV